MQCHGPSGIGSPLAPENQHPVPEFAIWMVRNGSDARGASAYEMPMLPFDEATLSPEQLEMILDYLNSMPQPTTGEALFHDYCANCHGADGKGGPTTRDLTAVDNLATEVPNNVREGHHPGEYDMRVEYMPAQDASRLTDAELGLIADYIATL
jgi:mono/diheme cytochrome c family protein